MFRICPIAHMVSDFPEKFGIPRQAGIVPELESVVVFEPEYRDPEALRGIEGFSHLWLIWQFSESLTETFSPTVRPPRLGGNVRMGVFATRSPFRPNSLGLSCVELKAVQERPQKPQIDPTLNVTPTPLHPLRRRPSRCPLGLCPRRGDDAGRVYCRPTFIKSPRGQTRGAQGCAGKRSPPALPEGPESGLCPRLCESHRPFQRFGQGAHGKRNRSARRQSK